MKKEIIKISCLIIGLVIFTFSFYVLLNNYFNARIAYESLECSDRAYMIYKNYDDQTDDIKTQDWLERVSECAGIEGEYQSRF